MSAPPIIRPPRSYAAICHDGTSHGLPTPTPLATLATLRRLASTRPGGALIEFDAGFGSASCWLLDGMDAVSTLTTIEREPLPLEIARRHLAHDQRLCLAQGSMSDLVPKLREEQFDLAVVAPTTLEPELIGPLLDLVRPAGLVALRDAWPDERARTQEDGAVAAFLAACAGRDDLRVVGDRKLRLLVAARH